VYGAIQGVQTITSAVLVVVISVAFAAGLFTMNQAARRVVAALALFFALLIPIGCINPFAAMDMEAGGKAPPTVTSILLWMGPLVAGLLALAWLLDPPRAKSGSDAKK
jgi:hypothetical protein